MKIEKQYKNTSDNNRQLFSNPDMYDTCKYFLRNHIDMVLNGLLELMLHANLLKLLAKRLNRDEPK